MKQKSKTPNEADRLARRHRKLVKRYGAPELIKAWIEQQTAHNTLALQAWMQDNKEIAPRVLNYRISAPGSFEQALKLRVMLENAGAM